jgi:hypothetical protein
MNKTLSILAAAVLTCMTLAVHAAEQKPVMPSPELGLERCQPPAQWDPIQERCVPPRPKDPLPPKPRALPQPIDMPTGPHIPKDPGMGDGTPAPGGDPVEPALPCPPGQTLVTLTNGQTTCAVAQPADTTMPNQTARPIVKPDIHGCVPPQRWDPTQEKCVVGIVIKPIDDPTRNTSRQADGGTPTSTPTHTVPVAPADRLTIKTKSSPPYAPQPPVSIEERTANPAPGEERTATPAPGSGKPDAGALGAIPPKCPRGEVWVRDPRSNKGGRCVRKPEPMD